MGASPWGGSEELWSRTAMFLKKNKHQVLVCVYEWSTEPEQIELLTSLGIEVVKFERTRKPKRFYTRAFETLFYKNYDQKFEKNFKLIDNFNPDIICVSQGSTFNISAHSKFTNYLSKTAIDYVIITHHSCETGGVLQYQQAQLEKQLIDKAKSNYFISERNLKTAERQLAYKIRNATIIQNPINIKSIGIKETRCIAGVLQMACVARLETASKGQDLLLQALSSDLWKERKFSLKLYGSGPDFEYINRLIHFYDLSNKVTIVGHIDIVDLIWEDNQVLILPSISEGLPLAIVEAMLSGRTVLSTDVGDISKYVKDSVTGFLAPTASVTCLSQVLENLWKNQNNLVQMGKNAYNHASSITDLDPAQTLAHSLFKIVKENNSHG